MLGVILGNFQGVWTVIVVLFLGQSEGICKIFLGSCSMNLDGYCRGVLGLFGGSCLVIWERVVLSRLCLRR